MMERDEVLILGDFRYTPSYCRSIARAGYRPVVADPVRCRFSAAARPKVETIDVGTGPDGLGNWLLELAARRPGLAAIMPVGDGTARVLAQVQDGLPAEAAAVTGSAEAVATCFDKLAMSRIVDEVGAPQAEYREAATLAGAATEVEALGLPAIIKPSRPSRSNLDVKAWVFATEDDLARFRAGLQELPGPFIVQRYVAGERLNVQVLAYEGELVERLVTVTTRSNRRDDTGNTVASVTMAATPELDEWTAAIIRRIRFSGLGCLQFYGRLDTGELTFLELNPRLGGAFAIAGRCGVDFPRLALDVWLHGLRPPRQLSDYEPGMRMAWIGGDVFGLLRARRRGEIGRLDSARWAAGIVGSAVRADAFTTFTWDDPLLLLRYEWTRRVVDRRSTGRAALRGRCAG